MTGLLTVLALRTALRWAAAALVGVTPPQAGTSPVPVRVRPAR